MDLFVSTEVESAVVGIFVVVVAKISHPMGRTTPSTPELALLVRLTEDVLEGLQCVFLIHAPVGHVEYNCALVAEGGNPPAPIAVRNAVRIQEMPVTVGKTDALEAGELRELDLFSTCDPSTSH